MSAVIQERNHGNVDTQSDDPRSRHFCSYIVPVLWHQHPAEGLTQILLVEDDENIRIMVSSICFTPIALLLPIKTPTGCTMRFLKKSIYPNSRRKQT